MVLLELDLPQVEKTPESERTLKPVVLVRFLVRSFSVEKTPESERTLKLGLHIVIKLLKG